MDTPITSNSEVTEKKKEVIQEIRKIQEKNALQLTMQKIYHDFQTFWFSNKIVVGASSFAVGVATKEVVETIMTLVILPILRTPFLHLKNALIRNKILMDAFSKSWIASISKAVGGVLWALLLWITVIASAFFLLEYFMNRKVAGVTSKIAQSDEKDFVKAKVAAKEEAVVPIFHTDVEKTKSQLIEEKVKEVKHFQGIAYNDISYGRAANQWGKDTSPIFYRP